jgi:hypothetical protein
MANVNARLNQGIEQRSGRARRLSWKGEHRKGAARSTIGHRKLLQAVKDPAERAIGKENL